MPGSREEGKKRFYRSLPPYRFTGKKMFAINTMPVSREEGKKRFTDPYRLTVFPAKKYRAKNS